MMPLQNRVDPWGQLHAHPSKASTRMGNRGISHDGHNQIVRPWAHKGWVCCLTSFKGIKHPKPFSAGNYSEPFFWMKPLPSLRDIDHACIAREIAATRSGMHGYEPMLPIRMNLATSGCHK
jgi:hypothetical protein